MEFGPLLRRRPTTHAPRFRGPDNPKVTHPLSNTLARCEVSPTSCTKWPEITGHREARRPWTEPEDGLSQSSILPEAASNA